VGAKFCVDCAAPLGRRCAACGSDGPPGAKFCPECGASLAPTARGDAAPPAPAPAGERRQLTVLFCDLVGSTPLSQQLDAEDWREVIAAYQQTASRAVARFGGHVAKNLGDGLLIYFGWPAAREDDPERAIRAGLAIVDAVQALGTEEGAAPAAPLPSAGGPRAGAALHVRIGMHTGPVVIADGGEVFGETANIAARVQGAAEPDTVLITAATQRLVAGLFVVEERGPQPLKGVREPMPLYRVVQPSGVRSRLDVAAGRLTRFVGREIELATLVDRWERARDGEGQTVLILGEAGVGKSRLAHRLRQHLAPAPHTWLECGAARYAEGTPFHPVIELVGRGLAFGAADTDAEKLAKVEAGLGALAAPETVALLADFLGLVLPAPLQMTADLQRRKTFELLVQWHLGLSEAQPLIVLFEDLHWCDASTLELLGRLIAQSPTTRMLVLATARPELTPSWPTREHTTTLRLGRLTKRQARDMVVALAGEDLPAGTLDALVARADGVPLYLEELTKSVVEPGVAPSVEAIPATLADSLTARLDRLSSAKEVAQRAAVLGREFPYALLAATAGMDGASLEHGLARLVEAELLYVRGVAPEATYTFKHALVQEAAYESLLKRTRQQLHGRVVDVLLGELAARAAAQPELVARHAELAGRIDEAIAQHQRACDLARARSAHEEAIRNVSEAIALLGTLAEGRDRDVREAALQLVLGFLLADARVYAAPEVASAFERAQVLCESVDEARGLGFALNGLAVVAHNAGQVDRAGALAERVIAIGEEIADDDLRVRGHSSLGLVDLYRGRFVSSLAHCEQALARYQPERQHLLMLDVGSSGDRDVPQLAYSALDLWMLGRPDRALARAHEATALARRVNHSSTLVFPLLFETMVHRLRRDAAAQRERAAELIAVSETHGFPFWQGLGRAFHAGARVAMGEPEAVAELLPGLVQSGGTGRRGGAPGLFAVLAEAYLAAGRLAEACGALETGLALSADTGQHFMDAELHRLQGELARAGGGVPAETEALFGRSLEVARAQQAQSLELRAATSLARLWGAQGRRGDARDLLGPLYARFSEGLDTGDLLEARALLAQL
jgi:class 3 adenylate cyclase/tetratricopeptide (TPR) repeat protein